MIESLLDNTHLMYPKVLFLFGIVCFFWWRVMRNRVNYFIVTAWLLLSSVYAWIEFAGMNSADTIPAWVFSESQIFGVYILNIALEDVVFAPVFGIMFYLFFITIKKSAVNHTTEYSKVVVFMLFALCTIFFFTFGSYFGKYQAIRAGIGLFGLYYSWDTWDMKHFIKIFSAVCIISIGWDIYSGTAEVQHWFYRYIDVPVNGKEYSIVFAQFDWWWFKVGKAWFPLSILPYYSISGGILTYGVLNGLSKKFPKIHRNLFEAIKQLKKEAKS